MSHKLWRVEKLKLSPICPPRTLRETAGSRDQRGQMKRSKGLASAGAEARSVEAEVGELLIRLLSSAREHFMGGLAEMDLTQPQGFALHYLEEPMAMGRLADE